MTNHSKTSKNRQQYIYKPTKSVALHRKSKTYFIVNYKKKKNQLGKYIHKYIIAKKKTSAKNVKFTYNGFCGVIYASYICVPAFLDERKKKPKKKKKVRTLQCMYKSRESVLNPYGREWV
jgi:hypothetical protein